MKFNDAILGAAVLALALAVYLASRGFPTLPGQPYGPGTFPILIAATMAATGVSLVIAGLGARTPALVIADRFRNRRALWRMAAVPAFVVAYILLSKPVGFPLVVPPLLGALLIVLGTRPWVAIVIALGTTAAFWVVFARFLLVPLPLGLLTDVIY